jgi:GNAT superfamily N-acetyltransferase
MKIDTELRPVSLPKDASELARICSAAFPERPTSGQEFLDAERRRAPERMHRKFVADCGDRLAGYAFVEVPDVAAAPGRLRVRVIVDPERIGTGLGARLYEAIEAEARACGARELVTEAAGAHPRAHRFLQDRGFAHCHRRIRSTLDLASVDAGEIGRGIDMLTDHFFPQAVRIACFRQMIDACADAPMRLYRLFDELWQDVPFGLTGAGPTLEAFVAEVLQDASFASEGTMIALDGERWIGLAALERRADFMLASMTGVVRDWRGRGLARWLKLATIRHALESGFAELRTVNDATNEAMLALNRSLGFRPTAVDVRYRKELR